MSKTNRAPEVSVIICALNAASTLPRQLKALENQETELPYEVILVDNGSDDDTRAVMEAWAQEPRENKFTVKVVDASATPGIPAARNTGARAASGRVLAFCDADDEVSPQWVQAFSEVQDKELAGGWIRAFDANGTPRPDAFGKGLIATPYLPHVGNCNCAITRARFFEIGGYDESLPRYGYEDVDISWRHQEADGVMRFIPEAEIHFTLSEGKSSIRKKYELGVGRVLMARRFPKYDSATYSLKSTVTGSVQQLLNILRQAVTQRKVVRRDVANWVASLGRIRGSIKYSGKNYVPARKLVKE